MVRGLPPVVSVWVTWCTVYLLNQSTVADWAPGRVQYEGKQRLVFVSALAGMTLPVTHSLGSYVTPMMPPVSVVMKEMRHQFIGGPLGSAVLTRLGSWMPVKVRSG